MSDRMRLVPRGSAGLCCDEAGLALGPVPLVSARRDALGRRHYAAQSEAKLARVLTLAAPTLSAEALARSIDEIGRIAAALNAGDEWRARAIATQLGLPPLTPDVMAGLAASAALEKQGFNPDQPRVPAGSEGAGEWTFAVPSYRAQVFARQKGVWERFHNAARALPNQSGTESFAYGETFAGEGGMRSDPGSKRRAGINEKLLTAARTATDGEGSPLYPQLATAIKIDQLTPEQAAAVYRFFADKQAFRTAGGSAALDKVGDPYAAAALFDTTVNYGPRGGAQTVQQAINDVAGKGTVPEDGQMGPATLDAYARLSQNPDTRAELLDALARRRTAYEGDPRHHITPAPERVEHFRYAGARD